MGRRRSIFKQKQFKQLSLLVVTLGIFGLVGLKYLNSIQAFTGNHAECTPFSASSYLVAGGSHFHGTAVLKNDGTTTWSASHGYSLRDPDGRWSFSGNTLDGHTVAFGASHTFNLGLIAPAASTRAITYSYNANMFLTNFGKIAHVCPTKYITVAAKPTISVTSPHSGQAVSGSNVVISASASQPTSGVKITKVVFYVSGSSIHTDDSSPYNASWNSTRYRNGSYTLSARVYDSLGQSRLSSSVSVTIRNTSSPPPSHTTTSPVPGSRTTTQTLPPDKTAPSKPTNFTAFLDEQTNTVVLSWSNSTDNRGIKGYKLDRSPDNKMWDTLVNNFTKNTFEDLTIGFNQPYYYRIQAIDTSGNKSAYANANVKTAGFDANVKANSDSTITTDDQGISILIPAGALSQDALCNVFPSTNLEAPQIDKLEVVSGPYEISCRDKDGNTITSFNKPLTVTIKLDTIAPGDTRTFSYFGYKDQNWSELTVTSHDAGARTDSLDLDNITGFSVMAKQKTKSAAGTVIKLIVIFGLIFGGTFVGLKLLLKRKAAKNYLNYMKKAKGW